MKKFNKTGPMRLRRVIGNLRTQRRIVAILAAAAGLLPASMAFAVPLDLTTTPPASGTINGAIYSTIDSQPTGTGVFQPFLTYQANGIEEGYNTSQGGNGQGFLDTKRVPQWSHDLTVGDLAKVTIGGKTYYQFELDANEKGNGNKDRLLSIDNIRIYTSDTDTANLVGNGANIDDLGKLRYAQNDLGSTANWVLIDASKKEGGSTSGSGSSDLVVYVPTDLFTGALDTDLLYFYTINGVNSRADSGFEEWSAKVVGVPDGGSTLLLLGSALTALGFLTGRRGLADHA
jgi:hypothetical protein